MKQALAVRHVPFEDLGTFETVLRADGFAVRYVEAGVEDLHAFLPEEPELLVILGGPIGAGEDADYPFLRDELAMLERRLARDLPVLGICLGSQLMARVLGARVYPAGRKEIGWSPLRLTDAGRAGPLAHLAPERTPVLHWHGDTFELPSGAVHLAATEVCENQAFAWGDSALGLQFHAEVTARGLERWFIGHALEIASTQAVTVVGLRADTQRWAEDLEAQGPRFFHEWLSAVVP